MQVYVYGVHVCMGTCVYGVHVCMGYMCVWVHVCMGACVYGVVIPLTIEFKDNYPVMGDVPLAIASCKYFI